MKALTNTDRSVAGSAALSGQFEESVTDRLGRFLINTARNLTQRDTPAVVRQRA